MVLVDILFWVSVISGGLLILLLLLSIIGGLDFDMDIGSSDIETDSSGIGAFKGLLTFVSSCTWVMRVLFVTGKHPGVAIGIGIAVGLVCFFILNYMMRVLLKQDSNINWEMNDAMFKNGEVYLKIPADASGNGIVQININGALREIKARSANNIEIKTGDAVTVTDIDGEYVLVTKNI